MKVSFNTRVAEEIEASSALIDNVLSEISLYQEDLETEIEQ